MSRLIKFRAWDTIENCWKIFDIQSMFEAKKVFNYKYRNFSNWQQYTGLKDKNGKEIYEGDIIKIYDNSFINSKYQEEYSAIKFVEFSKQNVFSSEWDGDCIGFHFMPHNDIEYDGNKNFNFDGDNVYKVIGNIFENPELLK